MKPQALFDQVRQYTGLARRFNRSHAKEVNHLAQLLCENGEAQRGQGALSDEERAYWLEQFQAEYRTWEPSFVISPEVQT